MVSCQKRWVLVSTNSVAFFSFVVFKLDANEKEQLEMFCAPHAFLPSADQTQRVFSAWRAAAQCSKDVASNCAISLNYPWQTLGANYLPQLWGDANSAAPFGATHRISGENRTIPRSKQGREQTWGGGTFGSKPTNQQPTKKSCSHPYMVVRGFFYSITFFFFNI